MFSRQTLTALIGAIMTAGMLGTGIAAGGEPAAAPATPIKIAVFPFELEDLAAAANPSDVPYLGKATDEAKQQLAQSGRYTLVDASKADMSAAGGKGLRNCGACGAEIAKQLGADQALVGVVSRISNTEYLIKIQITDAHSGEVVSNYSTDLRLGADYSWSRGVKSLVQDQMLAQK